MKKILVVGDLHLKQKLGYADYIKDGRESEKKEVFDFIVEQAKDCDGVIFMGDCFNDRNPISSVVREFTELLERLSGEREIFIIAGNHEIKNDGTTAIDYLSEVKGKNWYVVNNDLHGFTKGKELEFITLPYMTKGGLGVKTNDEAVKEIMDRLKEYHAGFLEGESLKILFHHNAMTGTFVQSGQSVNDFPEPVLPMDKLKSMFDMVIGGHIHSPKEYYKDEVVVTGSVFNNEINETGKFLWKVDIKERKIDKIALPGRHIYGIESDTELGKSYPENSIIKYTLREKKKDVEIEEIKEKLSKFDAYIFLEKIPKERKKLHYGGGESLLEFPIEELLKVYAEEQKLDYKLLMRGFELINK